MKTSVIGFLRIGKDRELKFATEKYFKGEITEAELLKTAQEIKKEHFLLQKNAGIDFIPSGDFSFYDGVLDAALQFNIVPKRYSEIGLSDLDTYFAMARGYQTEKGNVRALAMKKWFNTNYHYIVPEIDDDTEIKLTGSRLVDEYKEAKELGVETKPVTVGPFTLLKLARYTGVKTAEDFKDALAYGYKKLIAELAKAGVKWIQFDEPSLVKDLSAEDIALFEYLYKEILSSKAGVKILLQTYFGDVRDIYTNLTALDFDGIGLDFVEGKETLNLLEKNGFPAGKLLFAGVVNGKNIWRNNYEKTLEKLGKIASFAKEGIKQIVINASCSLLHVPFSLEAETDITDEYKKHFSFAKEKLTELSELASLSENDNKSADAISKNAALFAERRVNSHNEAVAKRVSAIKAEDYTRLPEFNEREKIQKARLNLPKFPTTTIGSFPQTADVRKNRQDFKKGLISREEYVAFNKKKISDCIKLQ